MVPASTMPSAVGAYASHTGTIVLNGGWLGSASRQQALAVLSEELGHHLDALLNSRDTPGDEGELFAAVLQGQVVPPARREGMGTEDDRGWLLLNGQRLAVETSSPIVTLVLSSETTVTEDGPQNLSVVFSRTGDASSTLTVAFTVGGSASFGSDYGQSGATSFGATTGSVTFAPGVTVAILSLDPSSDASSDGLETLTLNLTPGPGYRVGNAKRVSGTILDNDAAPGTVVRARLSGGNGWGDGWGRQNQLNWSAFAALKNDGSVITWGGGNGGDSSGVREKLAAGVVQIYSTRGAFAALKTDGSVVTWGNPLPGGDSRAVSSRLNSGVCQIFATDLMFAALKSDGSLVSWFGGIDAGLRYGVRDKLASGISQVFFTRSAFAAIKSDGSVVTWGKEDNGGDSNNVSKDLQAGVCQITASEGAFAALKRDGSVVTWGLSYLGGSSSPIQDLLSTGVIQIYSTNNSFAALKTDGSVVTWGGYLGNWGDSSSVRSSLSSGVTRIFSNGAAFAALKSDGSVVSWGDPDYGGDSSGVSRSLASNVSEIIANGNAFAALKRDGSVISWGNFRWGGDSSHMSSKLTSGVARVVPNFNAFAALKTDGSVVTWGGGVLIGQGSQFGGDSSGVGSQLAGGVVSFADPFHDDRLVPLALPSITLALTPGWVAEDGLGHLIYTFTRTGASADALTVFYTVGGTATLGSDYTGIAAAGTVKSVTFASGSATATVRVAPTADTAIEADETIALTLSSSAAYTIGTTTAVVGTILNDDAIITLAVAPATGVAEDGTANLIYTFTRTGATSSALRVNYTVGGTASFSSDYSQNGAVSFSATSGSISFAAGSSTATLTLDPTADSAIEANETVALSLSSGSGYSLGTSSAVVGTIIDDDSTLYNATTSTLPNEQGCLAFGAFDQLRRGSQSRSANGTTLTSPTEGVAGYSNRTQTATATPVNSAFPNLNQNVGFSLDFRLRVSSETHQVANRAGFSVILLDQNVRGIELGFWSDRIFSQSGGSTPFLTVGESVNNSNATATTYSLRILDQTYYLLAGSRLVLSGAVQDYSLWPKEPGLPFNPYTIPNFLFLGDNTRSASATVELGTISLGVTPAGTSGADTFSGTAAADRYNGLDGADQISGAESNDWLAGGGGSDTLNGGAGDDWLIGGSQADRFLFNSGANFNTSQLGVDTIVDFNVAEDRLSLARSTFSALAAGPALAASAFGVVSSDAAAASSAATIVYNSSSGALFYNPNGTTGGFASTTQAGGLFAKLWGGASGAAFPTLSNGVFEVV